MAISCALHQIGFRAAEKILEASDALEMDRQLSAHLANTARDIHDKLSNFDPSNFSPPISSYEAADLQEHLEDLERVLEELSMRGHGWREEKEFKQKVNFLISQFVEKIDNIIPRNRYAPIRE